MDQMTATTWKDRGRPLLLAGFLAATLLASWLSVFNDRLGALNLGRESLWWFPVLGSLLFLVPGVVVLLRSDWHPVGWLMVNLGFGFLFSFGPETWSISALSTVERWWLWLTGTSVSAVFWTVWTALILVFPGGLSSRAGGHRRLARACSDSMRCASSSPPSGPRSPLK